MKTSTQTTPTADELLAIAQRYAVEGDAAEEVGDEGTVYAAHLWADVFARCAAKAR